MQNELLNKDSVLGVFQKNLLQQIDKVSHVLEAAELGVDLVEDRKLLLELTWLSYKEKVRQEFVSMHDMLIDRENELLHKMQKRVNASLESMTSLEQLQKTFQAQETLLTEENIKLVQDRSRVRFLKGYKNILKRCEELCDNIQLMPRLDDVTPAFLKMPFSLIEEKLHLNNALKFEAYEKTSVVPKSRVAYIQSCDLNKPIRCFDLWDPPKNIPASTSCLYNVEVRSKSGSKVVRYINLPLDDFVFNSLGRLSLATGKKYVLKVVPVYMCSGCGGTEQTLDGVPLCIMLITDQSSSQNVFDKRKPYVSTHFVKPQPLRDGPTHVPDTLMPEMPEGRFHMKTIFLQHSSFEEIRLDDVVSRGLQIVPRADVSGCNGSFLLDESRYQMKECFLSHYSFEENRFECLQPLHSSSISTLQPVADDNSERPDDIDLKPVGFTISRGAGSKIKRAVRKIRK